MKIVCKHQMVVSALTFSCLGALPPASAAEQILVISAKPAPVSELDTPAAVSVIDGDDMRFAAPRVNLSESLNAVPGLQIQNRQNYAQDLQLSVRGFGARSTFGVRGLRIYVDGIPSTMPDGQGQTSNIDINSINSIDVLRGPFSVLYGNASGGVINVSTQTGKAPPSIEASSYYGSSDSWHYGLKASGATAESGHAGNMDYVVSTNRFTTQGYREHSAARKNLANAKLGFQLDEVSKLTLLLNSVDIKADDAGGLTSQEWHDNPRQSPRGEQYNTRKKTRQTQMGLRYERQLSEQDDLSIMAYAGERNTTQYQSIPANIQQIKPAHAGGVIALTRHYQGVDTRWTHQGNVGVPVTFSTGLDYENMTESRKGYENFVLINSTPAYGVKGDLRRNERNTMWNLDPYLQTQWQLTDRLELDAGLRYSSVWFDSHDFYITPKNGDDSGSTRYHKLLPVGAVRYALTDAWNVYLSAGRGFETPTINELSYRPDDKSGLNINLQPATSNTVEIGSKARLGNGLVSLTLFETNTDNEIVSAGNIGGRTSYKNAGKTRRQGTELALDQQFDENWSLKAAWTWLKAEYLTDVCQDTNCNGNRIPGIARNMAYVSYSYAPEQGWYAGSDIRYMGDIMANDQNSAKAPAWTTVGLSSGYKWSFNQIEMDLFGRIDNLFDRHYVGSVIVNEGMNRYYEPAPGRNYGIGLNVTWNWE
ncbi:TonB-dependent receptor [Citrobacter sp. JGM124]|nr:TonB-dependent receptor [Citrobacter sp. JGM124]